MVDLLIRDMSAKMKREIERRARVSNVSLSEIAKALIERGMSKGEKPRRLLGTEMFALLPREFRGDDLDFEIPDVANDPPDLS